MSEWSNEHRSLDPLFANEPGAYRWQRTPYAREWMDSANLPWVRIVTIVAGTQCGKSEALNNVAGYFLQHDPSACMLVLPRAKDVRTASRRRIRPMIEFSPALRAECTADAWDLTQTEFTFKRSVLYLRSSQVPADLASTPVRIVLCDEVDKWPRWTGREAGPLDLVMERQKTFVGRSIAYVTSTPVEPEGLIQRQLRAGDQRLYHLPCPHCAAWIVLLWEQVKWPEDVQTEREARRRAEAWYECQACGGRITDSQRLRAMDVGAWVPKGSDPAEWIAKGRNADRTEVRSYHLWSAYSPFLTWNKLVVQYLASRGVPESEQNWANSWLAVPWEHRIEEASESAVAQCIDPEHRRGVVPDSALVLVGAVDVQKDRMEWVVAAYGLDEECHVVQMGACSDWKSLSDALFVRWGDSQLRCVLVDSRHRRDEVVDWVRRWQPTARMIAGVHRESPEPFRTVKLDKHPRTGAPIPGGMAIWTVRVSQFKDLVAARLNRGASQREGRIHLPADSPPDWLHQLSAEQKVARRSAAGKVKEIWIKRPGRERNEAWDLLVYCSAASHLIRANLLRSASSPMRRPMPARRPGPPRRDRRGDEGGFGWPQS